MLQSVKYVSRRHALRPWCFWTSAPQSTIRLLDWTIVLPSLTIQYTIYFVGGNTSLFGPCQYWLQPVYSFNFINLLFWCTTVKHNKFHWFIVSAYLCNIAAIHGLVSELSIQGPGTTLMQSLFLQTLLLATYITIIISWL